MRLGTPDKEERATALKLAGALWLTGAFTTSTGMLIPGAPTHHAGLLLALAASQAAWGVACFLIPWNTANALTFHTPALLALPMIAVMVASSGGARSVATYDLFFIVSYCAYFFEAKEALGYAALCGLVHALPLLYDPHAVSEGMLVQLYIAAPSYLVLAFVMGRARARLVQLRYAADELSRVDPLTGLPNRRAFTERIESHIGGERSSDVTGLMLVDLDDFKEANTLYGHPGGDRVLCETAAALRSAARAEDMVARLGGDEFAVVAHRLDVDGMRGLAERALGAVRAAGSRLDTELPGVRVTASIGWALYPHTAGTVEDLIAAADVSLRGVKGSGKDSMLSPEDWLAGEASV
ncbi:MAG TPA: GGDEF domain-containing protein [Thermoleophilaceae bacterium]